MSLLKTAKATKLGTQRLNAYNKDAPSRNITPTRAVPLTALSRADNSSSQDDSNWQFSEVGGSLGTSIETDNEVNDLLRRKTASLLGKSPEDYTASTGSAPSGLITLSMASSASSSFSVSKAFGAAKKKMNDSKMKSTNNMPITSIDTSSQGPAEQKTMPLDNNITVKSPFSISVQREEVQKSREHAVPSIEELTKERASKFLKEESKKRAVKLLEKLEETKRVRSASKQRDLASLTEETKSKSTKKSQKQKLLDRLEKMGVKSEEVGLNMHKYTGGKLQKGTKTGKKRHKSTNPFDDDDMTVADVGDKYAPMALNDDFMQDVMAMAAGHLGGVNNAKSMDEILNAKEAQPDALHMLVKPESADMDEFMNLAALRRNSKKSALAKAKAARSTPSSPSPSNCKSQTIPPSTTGRSNTLPANRSKSGTQANDDWVTQNFRQKNELEQEMEECVTECALWRSECFASSPQDEPQVTATVDSRAKTTAASIPSKKLAERRAAINVKSKGSTTGPPIEAFGTLPMLDALGDTLTISSSASDRYLPSEASHSFLDLKESFAEKAASKANSHKALVHKKADAATLFCDMLENAVAPSVGGPFNQDPTLPNNHVALVHTTADAGTEFCDMLENAVAPSFGGTFKQDPHPLPLTDDDGSRKENSSWCVSFNEMVSSSSCQPSSTTPPNLVSPNQVEEELKTDHISPNSVMAASLIPPQKGNVVASEVKNAPPQQQVQTNVAQVTTSETKVPAATQVTLPSAMSRKSDFLEKGSLLDQDDAFWDTLSTIASSAHLNQNNQEEWKLSKNNNPEGIPEEQVVGCGVECPWEKTKVPVPTAVNTDVVAIETAKPLDDGSSESDISAVPSIPVEITYRSSNDEGMAGRSMIGKLGSAREDQPVGKAMDYLQNLLSADSSSTDSSLLYSTSTIKNGKNEEAHVTAEELEIAIMRGLEMAITNDESTLNVSGPSPPSSLKRRAAKHGEDDRGEQPLPSPSLPSHDSSLQSEQVNLVNELDGIVGKIEGVDVNVSAPTNSMNRKIEVASKKKNERVTSMLAKFQTIRARMNSATSDASNDTFLVSLNQEVMSVKANSNKSFDLGAIDQLLMDGADDCSYDTSALLLVVTRTEDEPNTVSSLEGDCPVTNSTNPPPVAIEERYEEVNGNTRIHSIPVNNTLEQGHPEASQSEPASPIRIEQRFEEVELSADVEQMKMTVAVQLTTPDDSDDDSSSLEVQTKKKHRKKKSSPKGKESPKSRKVKKSTKSKVTGDDRIVDIPSNISEFDAIVLEMLTPHSVHDNQKTEFHEPSPQEAKPRKSQIASPVAKQVESPKSHRSNTIKNAPQNEQSLHPPISSHEGNASSPRKGLPDQHNFVSPHRTTDRNESPITPRLDSIRARLDEKRRLRNLPLCSPGSSAQIGSLNVAEKLGSLVFPSESSLMASPVADIGPDLVAMQDMLEKYDTMVNQLLHQNGRLKRAGKPDDSSIGAESADLRRVLAQLRRQKELTIATARSSSASRSRHSTPIMGHSTPVMGHATPPSRGRPAPRPEDASPRFRASPRAPTSSPTRQRNSSRATTPSVRRSTQSSRDDQRHFTSDIRDKDLRESKESRNYRHTMSSLDRPSPQHRMLSPERRQSLPSRRGRLPSSDHLERCGSPSSHRLMSSPERPSRWSSPERLSRVSSPERRARTAFALDNAEQARSIREQLELARLTSRSIRSNQANLSLELNALKKKVDNKRRERAMIATGREECLEDIRDPGKHSHNREFFEVQDQWGDRDDMHGRMNSSNAAQNALDDAQMRLGGEYEYQLSDAERICNLEHAISDLRIVEQSKSGRLLQYLDDARTFNHTLPRYKS